MNGISKVLYVVLGIMIICTGVYCLFTPEITAMSLGYCVGLSMLLDAIGRFVFWKQEKDAGRGDGSYLAGAVVALVLAIVILASDVMQVALDMFIFYYVAIWLAVAGFMALYRGMKVHKLHKTFNTQIIATNWYIPVILGIIMVVFGIVCLFRPDIMAETIGIIIGLGIISLGADMITLVLSIPDAPEQ